MTPKEAARLFRSMQGQLRKDSREALKRTAKAGVKVAKERSSGRLSLAKLAAMDHPYARRHGAPRLNPSMINVQSGGFKSAWRYDARPINAGIPTASIINDSRVARFLDGGTRFMFRRPIRDVIERKAQTLFSSEMNSAIRRFESRY